MRLASTTLVTTLALALPLACNDGGGPGATTQDTSSAATTATTASSTTASETTASETTSSPTTGEPADPLMRCRPTCTADTDCTVNGGQDIGFRCVGGVCRPPLCTDDAACVLTESGWTDPCAEQAACAEGQACIDVGGEGRCALTPSMFLQCIDLGLDERTLPTIEGDAMVTVCGVTTATCQEDGTCRAPCTSDAACPAEVGHPTCELATGECICADDRDCQDTMKPGLIVCIAGRCGCNSDMDCTGGLNVDTCYANACGCASTATCSAQIYDGATQNCGPA